MSARESTEISNVDSIHHAKMKQEVKDEVNDDVNSGLRSIGLTKKEDMPKEEFITTASDTTNIEPLNSYTWTIPNFTKKKAPFVSPPFFDRKGRRFNLQIFPDGDSKTRGDFLCICISPDKKFNASQDSEENPSKVHFKMWAFKQNGAKCTVLDTESLLTAKESHRNSLNWQTLQRKQLLVDGQLKLHFWFCRNLRKKHQPKKKEQKVARSLSPSENRNDSPKKKQKQENAISTVVTQTQARSETQNEPKPEVVMSTLDVKPKKELISAGSKPTKNKPPRYSLNWTIPNFSQQDGPVNSPPFIDRKGRRFNLQIFPKGDGQTVDDFLCICICPDKKFNASKDSKEIPREIQFMLWAFASHGGKRLILDCKSTFTEKESFRETVNLQTLRRRSLLADDQLKLHFRFCEPKKNKKKQSLAQKPESLPQSHLTNMYIEQYFSGEYSDVTIVVDGRSFFCHKRILVERSRFFEFMYDLGKDRIDFDDISAPVFGQILYYIYTDKVPFLDAGNACELLSASERFQLNQLKEACENFILKNLITTSTASEIHKLATASNSPNLYAKTMEFLSKPQIETITLD